jgi:L-alanine-DL-glutamate epimerase-like enolase superfamily enzyme
MARAFAALWQGKDPLNIPERMGELHRYAAKNSTVKSAFDMALYDLAAKASNLPLYRFLGGTKRIVETDITIGINTPEKMAEQALEFKKSGASTIKIKLGHGVETDIERVTKIRIAVGNDITLRIDANQGWDFKEACYILDSIKSYNIQFCEQPMRTWYDDALPELCQRSPVKIAADESCYDHHDARKLINARSCHFINIKLAKSGGIQEATKIHEVAAAAGIECMVGGMLESRLAASANLHFIYASPSVKFYDLDSPMLGGLEDPIENGIRYNGYFVEIPDMPGIGADVSESFLSGCEKWSVG